MKTIPWKTLVILAFSSGLLTLGIWIAFFQPDEPDLSKAICQPDDLGERYIPYIPPNGTPIPTKSYADLGETVVESYAVELVDLQLTYTELTCSIIRYADETSAHQAFQKVCEERSKPIQPSVGEESCDSLGYAPQSLAFRRDEYLVLMSGDIGNIWSPAKAVDKRLR